jgi:hypothetical protein
MSQLLLEGMGMAMGMGMGSMMTILLQTFFRDGRDGDIQGVWSFGVNGFFIPPPGFAGLVLDESGTIIPTAAVGLICFDGAGGCSIELSAVVGGTLGSQVFNVTMNRLRFISSICRVRVSRFGRVTVFAKLTEVSTRLMTMSSLNLPLTIFLQLASKSFGFIAFDQFFVLDGQAVRIQRFAKLVNDFDNDNDKEHDDDNGNGNGNGVGTGHGNGGPSSGGGNYGPGGGGGPGMIGGPGGGKGGFGGIGGVNGGHGNNNFGSGDNNGNGNGNGYGNGNGKGNSKRNRNVNRNRGFGTCPSLMDDTIDDGFGRGNGFFDGGGSFDGSFGGGY